MLCVSVFFYTISVKVFSFSLLTIIHNIKGIFLIIRRKAKVVRYFDTDGFLRRVGMQTNEQTKISLKHKYFVFITISS